MRVTLPLTLVVSLGAVAPGPAAEPKVPLQLLSLEPAHHALLVDKEAEKLFLYEGHGAEPARLVRAWNATTGQKGGDKTSRGDLKTPLGIYFFTEMLEDHQLPAEYGLRALVLDYPNLFDRREGKTGSGIWLHATDERTRPFTAMRTRGCVVVTNQDMLDISKVIALHETPIVVDDDVQLVDVPAWKAARSELVTLVDDWIRTWAAGEMGRFGSYYAADFHADGKGRRAWIEHKRDVARATLRLSIDVDRLEAFTRGDDAIVRFGQLYLSQRLADYGSKTLWLKRRKGKWGIVSEAWRDATPTPALTEQLRQYQSGGSGPVVIASDPIAAAIPPNADGSATVLAATTERPDPLPIDAVRAVNSGASPSAYPVRDIEPVAVVRSTAVVDRPVNVEPAADPLNRREPRIAIERFLAEAGAGEVDVSFRLHHNSEADDLIRGSVLVIVKLETAAGTRYLAWPWGTSLIGGRPTAPLNGDPFAVRRFKDVRANLVGLPKDGVLRQVQVIVLDRHGREIDHLSYGN